MTTAISNPKSLGPAFNRLWLAFSSSKLGDGLMGAAAPLLAVSLTQDTVLIALSGSMYLLPWLFFAIAIGTAVDRIDRRRTLVAVAIVRAVIAAVLALMIFTGTLTIYGLLLATFLIGTADVFNDTALQSLIPTILTKDKIERGNSRFQMSDTVLQQFIGMPLGAVFFVYSAFLPFGLDALGFAIAAVMLVSIPRRHIPKLVVANDRPSFKTQMAEGLQYLWNDKRILRLVISTALIGFGFNISGATMVLFITKTLEVPQVLFGLLLLSGGVGGLIGAWAAPKLSAKLGRGTVLSWSIMLTSMFGLAQGLSPNMYFFAIASVLAGFAIACWNVLLMSVYHTLIPSEVFGRVHGTRRTIVWGIMPIGAFIGGVVAKIDLRAPFLVGCAFSLLITFIAFRMIRQLGNSSDNT